MRTQRTAATAPSRRAGTKTAQGPTSLRKPSGKKPGGQWAKGQDP
tara:strand:+ start:440 stop:574 length:135 start_codon:yes stop_codon:yes gene_type:complete